MTQPSRVLVVDDHAANRALAHETLADEGYEVVIATGGAEAIVAFDTHRPDCILLDVNMPGVDGFAVCARIRAMPLGKDVPILFLTAARDVDTFDRALKAGGDDYITKPVRPTELVIRVQAALKLRRLSTDLHEQYELLKKQRDDLMRVQLQKERLSAFIVHDLKNPVGAIDLHAQLLLREPGVSADARDAAAHIRASARQLTRMIMNLLDMSKADEGKLAPNRTDVDLRALVAAVMDDMEIVGRQHRVRVRSVIGAERLHADEDLVRRMVTNLVENAIRHAPRDSDVIVATSAVVGATELRVSDSGAGVPPELRERVFDPFVQLDSGERAVGHAGRGLGLAFCKLVAEAHGGRIWIEDAAPGAMFCVRFPSDL